jgi:hypothetical protein
MRREDVSPEEFRRYWESDEFSGYIERIAALYGVKRFAKNLTLRVGLNQTVMDELGTGSPFDGTVEYWWDSAGDVADINRSEAAVALKEEISAYQLQFTDRAQSRAFFTEG